MKPREFIVPENAEQVYQSILLKILDVVQEEKDLGIDRYCANRIEKIVSDELLVYEVVVGECSNEELE